MAIKSNFAKFLLHALLPGIGTSIVGYTDNNAGLAKDEDKLYTKFVKGLNSVFSPDKAWFDYDKWNSAGESFIDKQTGQNLTGAELQANQFTADEAQKQRDFEEYLSSTAYQRQVADMRAAGVNPALAMSGSGGASTPSGAVASSVTPSSGMSFSDLMQVFMMPLERKLLKAQAKNLQDQGQAALINAEANTRNAGSNERNAGAAEQNASAHRLEAETNRMRAEIERSRVESLVSLNEAEKDRLSEQTALLKVQREQLPRQLAVAEKNADSEQKRAIAALRQAEAAVQNAATNDRLADYETSLKYAQELLTWYQAEGQKVIAENLPERTRAEIDNLIKEGVYLDKRGNLVDRQGRLVTAQTVKTYVNVGTDLSGAVNQWINPFSKGPGASASPGIDLSGAYQGVAYGYD